MFNLFLAVFPEIFIINATFILLIHGVVFSTSKKDDYPPLVSNVGWLGLLSVLITLLLLAAGAPLLTIAHLFWNNFFRRDNFTYFCQILLLLSTAGTISMCFVYQKGIYNFDSSSLCTCRRFDRPCPCHNICTFGCYYRTFQRISFQGYLSSSRSFRFNLDYVTASDRWQRTL